ncbi:hypothetical protein J4219_00305 [Candidatus Woesearchaeota archaeon]|nr:hypothetical protein [Candidatus Woesearchaeota archaeon]
MPQDILFLDKDCTLGEFYQGGCGLYLGAFEFLEEQKDKGRKLIVATHAGEKGRVHLDGVKHLLSGYMGKEQLTSSNGFYIRPDKTVHKINDDFAKRSDLMNDDERKKAYAELSQFADAAQDYKKPQSERDAARKKQYEISDFLNVYLNRLTREPFNEGSRYVNPYSGRGNGAKDLVIARRLIDPINYADLRTVLVGDDSDREGTAPTDIETPLIQVTQSKFPKGWKPISATIDTLFSSEEKPSEVFDQLFRSGKRMKNGVRLVSIGKFKMDFERGTYGSRLAIWSQ